MEHKVILWIMNKNWSTYLGRPTLCDQYDSTQKLIDYDVDHLEIQRFFGNLKLFTCSFLKPEVVVRDQRRNLLERLVQEWVRIVFREKARVGENLGFRIDEDELGHRRGPDLVQEQLSDLVRNFRLVLEEHGWRWHLDNNCLTHPNQIQNFPSYAGIS